MNINAPIQKLLADGNLGVLVPIDFSDSENLALAMLGEKTHPHTKPLEVNMEFSTRNKSKRLNNCIPISSLLGLLCVDSSACGLIREIEPNLIFHPVAVVNLGLTFYVV